MTAVYGHDCTGAELFACPKDGQLAGYNTGSGDVPWSTAQFAEFPTAIRIGQDPDLTRLEYTSDLLDIENYAGTTLEAPGWLSNARTARQSGQRPGQRDPGFYISADNAGDLAQKLMSAGYMSGVPVVIAHWGISPQNAAGMLGQKIGPMVVVGVQYARQQNWDDDVWDGSWLAGGSTGATSGPPTDWAETMMAELPMLSEGATGQHVKSVQGLCVSLGHTLAVDGVFGPITHGAVLTVQRAAGIAQDGIVGPQTWHALLSVPQPAA